MTKAVTSQTFEQEVLKSDKPVLVDFWAPWCGPCVALSPTLEELSKDKADSLNVVKVNVDENKDIAEKYGIQGIPALLMFKEGKVVDQIVGGRKKSDLYAWADQAAAKEATAGKTAEEAKAASVETNKRAEEDMIKKLAKPVSYIVSGPLIASQALTIAGGAIVMTAVPGVGPAVLGAGAIAASVRRIYDVVKVTSHIMSGKAKTEEDIVKLKQDAKEQAKRPLMQAVNLAASATVLGAGICLFGVAAAAGSTLAMLGAGALAAKMTLSGGAGVLARTTSMLFGKKLDKFSKKLEESQNQKGMHCVPAPSAASPAPAIPAIDQTFNVKAEKPAAETLDNKNQNKPEPPAPKA